MPEELDFLTILFSGYMAIFSRFQDWDLTSFCVLRTDSCSLTIITRIFKNKTQKIVNLKKKHQKQPKRKKKKNQIYADNSTMQSVGHTAYYEDLDFF
jgi:hypothetical protein